VKRSAPVSSRETQKKALVGVLVCVLALAAAVALVAPDGQGIRIHGAAARHSVSQRVAMSATRTFQKLDEEEAAPPPAEDAAEEDAAPADAAAAEEEAPADEDKSEDKKDEDKADDDEDDDAEEEGSGGKIVLVGDDELNVAMQRYYEEHPGAFQWSLWQQIIGGGLALICCAVLVYSEVNAMLLVRDLDALKAADLLSAPKSIELSQRELWWGNGVKAQWRTLVTASSFGMCCVSIFVAFSSECPMLDKLGDKYDLSHTSSNGNCVLLAILLAVVNAGGLCFLLTGCVWMCTRPLPALLLIGLAISADWYNTSDDILTLCMWMLCTGAACGAYYYFTSSDDKEEEQEGLLNKGPREFV